MNQVRLLLIGLALAATNCGGCSDREADRADARAADAAKRDAPDLDAPVDVANDAPVDAPPPVVDPECAGASASCTTTPVTFIPITAPARPANMVRVDDTLYLSTYDLVNDQVTAGRVIAADLTSTTQSTLIPGANAYGLAAARGWVYAVELDTASGSIWRVRPGVAPVQLVTGRPFLRAVTADDTHVYWAEGTSIVRRAIAGGSIEPVMPCSAAVTLVVDDTDVYCAQYDHDIFRAPKTGTQQPAAIAYSTYPFTHMIKCGTDLFATNVGEPKLFRVPMPMGPLSTFANPPGIGRFYGVAATMQHFYVTVYGMAVGVYKIDRTTAAHQLLVPGEFAEAAPVAWNGQLLFIARDVGVRRCVD